MDAQNPELRQIPTRAESSGSSAGLFRAGELTSIHVPAQAEEAVRDLVLATDDGSRPAHPT